MFKKEGLALVIFHTIEEVVRMNMEPSRQEKIVIVDENDDVIGHKERGAIMQDDIYRVAALWITNSNGDVLLAQRALTKLHDPGKWGPAVAGTVEQGEDYDMNIRKEAEEEIGLKNVQPKKVNKERVFGEHNHFTQWFLLEMDVPIDSFIINVAEVQAVQWFPKGQLLKEIESAPDKFLGTMKQWAELFCK